jgi:hypothetical protein
MVELRLPNIKGNDREQLIQIRSYLYQLVEQLQYELNALGTPSTANIEPTVVAVKTPDSKWVSLGKTTEAVPPTQLARNGDGVFYRALGKHLFISVSCGVAYNGEPVKVNVTPIPKEYRPKYDTKVLCPCDGNATAILSVTADGNIYVSSASDDTPIQINSIDGYIDYWV